MQINDLRIEKFNKISKLSSLSKPELLSNLCIIDSFDYAKNVQSFYATDRNGNFYQIYIGHTTQQSQINQIVYLKDCPKIILLQDQSESLIIEQRIQERLSNFLIKNQQQKNVPYLDEQDARRIVMNVSESLVNYLQCKIKIYDCISPNNIVLNSGSWQLSVVGLVLGVDQNSLEYSLNQLQNNQNRMTFALGCLLFKLIFGFTPVNSNTKKFNDFKTSNFLKRLQFQQNQKLLKVYYYTQRLTQISSNCLKLLEKSLSSKMNLSEWLLDQYFRSQLSYSNVQTSSLKNKQLSMINSVDPSNYSILMPAIDYKKKHRFQKLNHKRIQSSDEPSLPQSLSQLKKHSIFSNILVSQAIQNKLSSSKVENNQQQLTMITSNYFYNQAFDPEQDNPCLSLFNFIENQRHKNPRQFNNGQYQNRLKLYAYPYAVAFQLLKVIKQQPIQLKRKIKRVIQMLLQISQLHYPRTVPPLHNTQLTIQSFDQIKQVYRQNINQLYQQFLNQAMKKYNYHSQNQSMKQRQKRKSQGLEYYRLCLKLLQASLIVRKGGSDLNLTRIYTSQRKQIENDLNQLLARYFPQKPLID